VKSIAILAAGVALGLAVVSCSSRKGGGVQTASLDGERIYREQCVRCHGANGEGVAGKHDETLYGEKSVESLSRLIARTMPEDREQKTRPDVARAVAEYLHGAFYSPEARARNHPAKVEFSRLTHRQYRESIADLVGGFRTVRQAAKTGGLAAEYFSSEGMNKKKAKALERTDPTVAFDFGEGAPEKGIAADQFSVAWNGSLLAPRTGAYSFRVTTPNGARLYFNTDLAAGDNNTRDDSDARRQASLIDLWVSSEGTVRVGEAEVFLLGGRSYPLRLDFFKFKEKTASVKFEWKPPHGVWQVVPAEALSPERSSMTTIVGTPFPPDDSSLGYERGTSISKAWHEATTKAAVEVAGGVVSRLDLLTRTDRRSTNRVEALRSFCADFAERAFRRPLDPGLRAAVVDRHFSDGAAPETAVKRSLLLVLTSPRFLYPGTPAAADDHAVASRLALAMWDSLPDAELRRAANQGELQTPEQVRKQAARMVDDPRTRAKVGEFFRQWLPVEEGDDLSKDRKAYPDFDELVLSDLRTSLERFVDHVVWSEGSDYRQLLQADYLFLNGRLARFYGVDGPKGDDFVPVRFDPAQRAGIFTHPFILSALSYHKSTSPIHRGVFLTRNVFGRFLKPPPMAIEFMDDRFDPSLTMREKVTELTSKPNCMGCHVTINPLGFSLEAYDAVGRFRTTDNNKPVDTVSEYTTADGTTLKLRGPRDLADHAVASADARRGFVRQLFQQTVKQAPAAYGATTLDRLDQAFVQSGQNVRGLVLEVAVTAALPSQPVKVASNP
jgi:hypothetical protein